MVCQACGSEVAVGARFCASCGRPLGTVDDERRVVTVLFADLVGFTTLSERLDPELVKNLVDRCFNRLALDVTAFGGRVDKVVGDAIVAIFGAPVAHEDDAERAVRAALRMHETLATEAESIGQELRLRIGVNTGEVLVGAMGAAGSVTAMGDVVNTASRLQAAAAPGEVLVGPATHAATARTIAYDERGLIAAKGREEPVATWCALSPVLPPGTRARREGVHLVGRDHEIGVLRHAVDTSMAHDRALLVVLLGDVGMGKSRLADEVAALATAEHRAVVREGRCVPYGEANVWWPVAEALRGALGVEEGHDRECALATLREQVAATLGGDCGDSGSDGGPRVDADEVERTAVGLLTLLGYEPLGGAEPAAVVHDAARALGTYAAATARRRPLVLQISDLHFADDVVLHLLDDVFAQVHHLPVVALVTARPTLLDRWRPRPGRHNELLLHLDPLDRAATGELLEALTGDPVPAEVADAFHDRSGGNPFYVEELVSLLDGPGGPSSPAALTRAAAFPETLPGTLRGLVAARLDDLAPSVRSVLQDAAVLGTRGTMEALARMASALDRGIDVADAMAQLVTDEIMVVEGDRWAFRSDLVREVAYQTITKADRAARHVGIAWYMEQHVASQDPRPVWVADQLAHHYAEAATLADELGSVGPGPWFPSDLRERARRWLVEVAARARRDLALPTARRHYTKALDLLAPSLDTHAAEVVPLLVERSQIALDLWDVDAARADVTEAERLADQVGDDSARARTLVARGAVEQREGRTDDAVATLAEAAEFFQRLGDHAGRARALRERAMAEILDGRVEDADTSARAALAAFEEAGDRAGQGWAHQHLAWIAFVTANTAVADQHARAAEEIFTALDDPRGRGWAWGIAGWIRFQQGRVDEATVLGERTLAEAHELGDPWAVGMTQLLLASVRLWTGRTEDAVGLASEALGAFEQIADPYGRGQASAVLGRAMTMHGRVEEGLDLLHRAGNPPGMERGRGPASGQMARMALFATAIQIGQPELVDDVVGELAEIASAGSGEATVALGMHALQHGDVALAAAHLFRDETEAPSANLGAVRALVAALSGRDDVESLAHVALARDGVTYLDRAVVGTARAVAAIRASARTDPVDVARLRREAHSTMRGVLAEIDGTGDEVAAAVFRLVAARVGEALADPDPVVTPAEAEAGLARLGVDASGWRRILDLASAPAPV